ncbi:MAG: xanthine dehydrogenase family protein subunit M [Candidatus Aminicenantes bacterium]|nr:xanthine dehydrogenase family protein subunit M [Candidatus Aminicenantes bacterium]
MIRDFVYLRADTLKETLDILEQCKDDSKIICGGQSLLILMRQGLVSPRYLIDIKHLEELDYIKFSSQEGLKIGAITTHRTLEKSALIKKRYPVLVDMEKNLASVQTRNWGTIGGNLAHGDPTGDPGPVFIALNAIVKTANKERERTLPLEEFFIDFFETALEENELLIEIQIPVVPPKTAVAYEKFNIIKNDQGIVSVAASMTADDSGIKCKDARIVLGAAAPVPKRAKAAEQMLRGQKLNERLLDQAAEKASKEAEPVADVHASEDYRKFLVKALTKKMVMRSWEQAKRLT